jgi:hypothetical protein
MWPYHWRDERNPFAHLERGDGMEGMPPNVDLDAYRETGAEVDYVIVWCRPGKLDDPVTVAVQQQLDRGYHRVAVSAAGHAEVYARRP